MLTAEMKAVLIAGKDRALVFGRDEQVIVVPVDEANANETLYSAYRESVVNLPFAGVFAMVEGNPVCRCASAESVPVMILATGAYSRHVAEKIRAEQSPKGDSVSWLERLFALPSEFRSA